MDLLKNNLFSRLVLVSLCCMHLLFLSEPASTLSAAEQEQRLEYFQIRMGIPIKISVYVKDEAQANTATTEAYRRIKELDRLLSDYDPDSELNQLCHVWKPGQFWPVSEELHQLLQISQEISKDSKGAFDVTVGPVVQLWRKSRRKKKLPTPEQIKTAHQSIGYQFVEIAPNADKIRLRRANMQLDLGGIAKGYAADEALKILRKHGINRVLIDAGGDIVVGDPPPGRDFWKIAIASFNDPEQQVTDFVYLKNAAIATSGDAYQYIEIDGKRYSHIVDPKTGLGLTTSSSVTVIAPSGTIADAYASTVSVLGPVKGIKFIDRHPSTASLVLTEDKSFRSRNWSRFLVPDKKNDAPH